MTWTELTQTLSDEKRETTQAMHAIYAAIENAQIARKQEREKEKMEKKIILDLTGKKMVEVIVVEKQNEKEEKEEKEKPEEDQEPEDQEFKQDHHCNWWGKLAI